MWVSHMPVIKMRNLQGTVRLARGRRYARNKQDIIPRAAAAIGHTHTHSAGGVMEEITVLVIRKVTSDCPIAGNCIAERERRNERTREREYERRRSGKK